MQNNLTKMVNAALDAMEAPINSLAFRIKALEDKKIEKGDPGVGVAGAMINRTGELLITLSNGEMVNLGPVVGKDANQEEIKSFIKDTIDSLTIKEEIAAHVSNIELPSVDMDQVKTIIVDNINEAVSNLELPVAEIQPEFVKGIVSEVLSEIELPRGADGKDADPVDYETVKAIVADNVTEAVSKIPVPRDGVDGKSVDIEEVKSLISDNINEAVSNLELPVAEIQPEFVKGIVSEVLSEIELPRGADGKDADPVDYETVKAIVADNVTEAVSKIPVPRDGVDGKSVDIEEVKSLISQEVDSAVSSLEIPAPVIEPEFVKGIVSEVISTIELPKGADGRDGVDGKSVDIEEVKSLISDNINEAVSNLELPVAEVKPEFVKGIVSEVLSEIELPRGADGKDADPVDYETVKAIVADNVTEAVSKIPVPRDGVDGKSVDIEEVKSLISDNINEAVSNLELPVAEVKPEFVKGIVSEVLSEIELPRGADGKDADPVDYETVKAIVADNVTEAVSKIPVPRDGVDGKSVDIEEVKSLISQEVDSAVSSLEIPAPVIEPEFVKGIVSEVISTIELPKGGDGRDGVDGKSVDIEEVKSLISDNINEAVSNLELPVAEIQPEFVKGIVSEVLSEIELPRGADGKDADPVDYETVKAIVADNVTEAVSKIPVPRDGVDGKSVDIEEVKSLISQEVDSAVSSLEIPAPVIEPEFVKGIVSEVISTIELPKGADGRDGVDGKSVDIEEVKSLISDNINEAVSNLELPVAEVKPEFVKGIVSEVLSEIELPRGADGKDADPVDYETVKAIVADNVTEAVSKIPVPRDGVDGKSVDIEEVKSLISQEVDSAVSSLEIPAPVIEPEFVKGIVSEVISTIELPKGADGRDGVDGKSVDIEEVKSLISDNINEAVSNLELPVAEVKPEFVKGIVSEVLSEIELPRGADGKDADPVDYETVKAIVADNVTEAVSKIPVPRDGVDGKSVDIEEVKSLISQEVDSAVSSLEIPAPVIEPEFVKGIVSEVISTIELPKGADGRDGVDGKSVEPETVKQFVQEAVEALPKPLDGKDGRDGVDGKSVDIEEVKSLISDNINEAVSNLELPVAEVKPEFVKGIVSEVLSEIELPRGADGKDADPVDYETVKAIVADNVTEAVSKIPVPRDGVDGKSVDIEEVKSLISKEVDSAVSSLEIPAPVIEPEFVKGIVSEVISTIELPKGADGRDGVDGKSVEPETVKRFVQEAVEALPKPLDGKDGRDGVDGKNGRDGIDGEDGKDAIELEILPEINPEKSYVRNTYAKHDGGIWRAFERTSGFKGWECIVEGIKSISIDQNGERNFSFKIELSSGLIDQKSFTIPTTIDKGVFSEGKSYEKGDGVTFGGSYWIAQKDTTSKPGTDDGFRLAVKRGRDGKDGIVKTVEKNPVVRL